MFSVYLFCQNYNKDTIEDQAEQKCYNDSVITANNLNDTLPSHKERNRGWSDGDITHQVSGISGN